MSNMKQELLNIEAELSERQALAKTKAQRRADLTRAISRMIAQQELDAVDHTARIERARAELSECEAWLATWPDVERELCERVKVAGEYRALEQQEQRMERLKELQGAEAQLRREFAERHIEFVKVAYELREALREKEQIANKSFENGHPIRDRIGSVEMPPWARIVGTESSVEMAQKMVKEVAEKG
jgi:hypothetical protein